MGTPLRVLMIEDSEDDAVLLVRELRRGGYDVTSQRVDTPSAMSAAMDSQKWDLVICDYSMPHFSGTDALKRLRETGSETPFIFLSGTIGEETAVAALKEGAQDYIMKSNLKRLLPAIRRELREIEERRERKRLEQQVQQLQRFESIGRLAGGIAHDVNNALGVILGWAQLGYDEAPENSSIRTKFQAIRQQAQSTAGMTKQLLAFARRQVLQPRNLNLNDFVSQAKTLLRSVIGNQIEFDILLSSSLPVVRADPTQIDQVLMNLCLNARDAMPQGGRLAVKTEEATISEEFCRIHSYGVPGKYVSLTVSDTGMGMERATLERIFEPFFTTKELGKGTGLGLATVYGIVKQHGGFVNVYSEPNQGTTFRVYLPAHNGSPDKEQPITTKQILSGKETILIAEDNEDLAELARRALISRGYQVILAQNGSEALHLFKERSKEIQLVLLDIAMPGLGGFEAYSEMQAIVPDLSVIFTSGHSQEFGPLESKIPKNAAFLQKPYDLETLSRIVRHTLDTGDSPS